MFESVKTTIEIFEKKKNANELTDKQKKLKLNLKTAPTYHILFLVTKQFEVFVHFYNLQVEKLYEKFCFFSVHFR